MDGLELRALKVSLTAPTHSVQPTFLSGPTCRASVTSFLWRYGFM